MTWKQIYETRLTNYYYWLKVLLTIISGMFCVNNLFWLYILFIVAIWGFIDYEYKEDLPFKENDRIKLIESYDMHDYYFVRYADNNQKQVVITLFPGSGKEYEKIIDIKRIRKEI
jgi:hypothetical protein